MTTNYRKNPVINISSVTSGVYSGFEAINKQLKKELKTNRVVAIETYPATNKQALIEGLAKVGFDAVYDTDDANLSKDALNEYLYDDLTDDRVFGYFTHKSVESITDKEKFETLQNKINQEKGTVLLIGLGSSRFVENPLIIFTSVTRWEIQMRYRNQSSDNYNAYNFGEDPLRMFKRGYFVDWRIADNYKDKLWNHIDYYMDTDLVDHPKMMKHSDYKLALNDVVSQPFSLVPYYDPGVWGGHWMQEKFGLDRDKPNFAWSFNGLPEENACLLQVGDETFKTQAMDLVLFAPKQLLGEKNMARFGREFPIRFDFLDTMGGGNLSLQVHPKVDYAMRNFGLHYTQDESYYILDAKDDAYVYLGVKDGTKLDELMSDLEKANRGEGGFDDEKYINKIPAKKHDHFLIPSGTIHCSGSDTMVLEISHTPYIFTFKLWDWDRLGMDGRPRPVHLDHAKHAIDTSRTTQWVHDQLVNDITVLEDNDGIKKERTGLHELEFVDTVRTWFDKPYTTETRNTFHMLMLVEGESATVTSDTNEFEPFDVYYAECFIIPAAVKSFTITPKQKGSCAMIDAFVRHSEQ
jgi:mannose-6-phosphate isomerase class I